MNFEEISASYTQCKRCTGWFHEDHIIECITKEGEYLADLCAQCLEHWLSFSGEHQ